MGALFVHLQLHVRRLPLPRDDECAVGGVRLHVRNLKMQIGAKSRGEPIPHIHGMGTAIPEKDLILFDELAQ